MVSVATLAQRWFGGVARAVVTEDGDFSRALFQAAIPTRAERYVANALFWILAACLVGGALLAAAVLSAPPSVPRAAMAVLGLLLVLLPALLAAGALFGYPYFRRSERQREIDANLPHGLNYLLALAAAGLQPRQLFRSLASQRVYGALAEECELVSRDLDLLGMDILSALRSAQQRTPSEKFKEFLQGAISAFSSGVDLEMYLKSKGEQYTREEIETQRQSLDVIGLMAETFLVVVVAAPLFLLVLLSVMSISSGDDVVFWGYVIALAYIPLSQAGIAVVVQSLNPRVWS